MTEGTEKAWVEEVPEDDAEGVVSKEYNGNRSNMAPRSVVRWKELNGQHRLYRTSQGEALKAKETSGDGHGAISEASSARRDLEACLS